MSYALSINNITMKQINRHKLYATIYKNPKQTKSELSQLMGMSISTIDTNIRQLTKDRLILAIGLKNSTGGRKATFYDINASAKYALGVSILVNKAIIAITDLHGKLVLTHSFELNGLNTPCDEYLTKLSSLIDQLIESKKFIKKDFLGISVAVQGIVSMPNLSNKRSSNYLNSIEEAYVSYGKILNNEGLSLKEIQKHFDLPCILVHDSKAAAFAELWERPQINNAFLILLNQNLGGAIIFNNMVQYGNTGAGGLIEHMQIHPQDELPRTCYCGGSNCLETYCSKVALENSSKLPLEMFFTKVRDPLQKDHAKNQVIWDKFLKNLSYALKNVKMLIDGKLILSGTIASYMQEADLDQLLFLINEQNPFPISKKELILSKSSDMVVALGASRYLINIFLETFDANPVSDSQYNKRTVTVNYPLPKGSELPLNGSPD